MSTIDRNLKQNFFIPCLLSALFPFYAFFQMTILNALAENRMHTLHLSDAGLGMLSSAYLYGDALLLIPAGLILDRFNAKYVIILSFAVLLVSSSLFYFTNSFYVATATRFVAGMAHAFALISCFRLAALYVPNNKQGLVMSLILTIAFLGGFFAQSPFVWLLQTIGFNESVIMEIFAGAIIFLILIFKIHPPHISLPKHSHKTHLFYNLLSAIKKPQNTIAAIYIALMGVPFMILGALYGIEYLVHYKKFSSMDASFNVSLIFIGMIAGSPFFGWLFDRATFQKRMMLTGVLLTFICCLLVFYLQHSLWFVFLAIGFFSSVQVLGYPIISARNSKETLSTSMGLANFFIMILLGSLQLATGSLATIFSLQISLLWMMSLACLLSGICIIFL